MPRTKAPGHTTANRARQVTRRIVEPDGRGPRKYASALPLPTGMETSFDAVLSCIFGGVQLESGWVGARVRKSLAKPYDFRFSKNIPAGDVL